MGNDMTMVEAAEKIINERDDAFMVVNLVIENGYFLRNDSTGLLVEKNNTASCSGSFFSILRRTKNSPRAHFFGLLGKKMKMVLGTINIVPRLISNCDELRKMCEIDVFAEENYFQLSELANKIEKIMGIKIRINLAPIKFNWENDNFRPNKIFKRK
jgi:hypothetical protein